MALLPQLVNDELARSVAEGTSRAGNITKQHVLLAYAVPAPRSTSATDQGIARLVQSLRAALEEEGIPVECADVTKNANMMALAARGVERAALVCLCFSDAYMKDDICRREAQYANMLGKELIPVRMQANVFPKGEVSACLRPAGGRISSPVRRRCGLRRVVLCSFTHGCCPCGSCCRCCCVDGFCPRLAGVLVPDQPVD